MAECPDRLGQARRHPHSQEPPQRPHSNRPLSLDIKAPEIISFSLQVFHALFVHEPLPLSRARQVVAPKMLRTFVHVGQCGKVSSHYFISSRHLTGIFRRRILRHKDHILCFCGTASHGNITNPITTCNGLVSGRG